MRVENLTPVLTAAPGERATMRLRIANTDAGPLTYRLRVVGFDDTHVLLPPPTAPLPEGASEDVDVEFVIPEAFAAGHHSVAVEVTPERPGATPAIAGVTVAVGSIDAVAIAVVPSTIRGHRKGSFRIDIDNRAGESIDLDLAGEGPDVVVKLRPDRVRLRPGDRIRTSGKVRGPRLLVGEPVPRPLTITARGQSAPSYAPATFIQRPVLPRGLRAAVAVLAAVALWAGALGLGLLWWNHRNQPEVAEPAAALVDTDGDGIPDTPGDALVDTDGDGVGDTQAAVVAAEVAKAAAEASDEQNAGGPTTPTRTTIGGKVSAGATGDDAGVTITLSTLELGEQPPPTATLLNPAGESRAVKLWPARAGTFGADAAPRQTESVESARSGDDGAFLFNRVPIRQTYEVNFALAGFDSQSFIVTPSEDGSPVELEVELQPATGAISGVVVGPGGPLGNVELTLTDGTLMFATTSSTEPGEVGTWALGGISTPGSYTLTATRRGYGTEVLQISLDPGEQRSGILISMVPGVGSIGGRITSGGSPLGGVTLTASSGDRSATTTSLTEGDRGRYTFPQLEIPGRYTVTAAADGYLTQTRVVSIDGNVTGIDFDMVPTTASIDGTVISTRDGPLVGANIRLSRDELAFNTPSASQPPGSFQIDDLPPGTYLIEFSHFNHLPSSQIVTLAAGDELHLGRIVLQFSDRPDIDQDGSLRVAVVDSKGAPLTGATVSLTEVGSTEAFDEKSDPDAPTYVFEPVPIGTYNVTVTKDLYRRSIRRISVGIDRAQLTVPLYELGQASGRLVDSLDGTELDDYDVQIWRIERPDPILIDTITVPDGAPADKGPDNDQIRWETDPNSLTSGNYEVRVVNPPPGYRVVPDQTLQPPQPPMRFRVSPTSDEPLDLADIEADIFPELTGIVLAPQYAAATNTVSFLPIDRDDLTVTLKCDSDPDSLASVTLTDEGEGPELDSFAFSPIELDEAHLFGDCTLTATATGFVTATIPIPTPLVPTDGTVDPDKEVNIALVRPEDVAGHTYWVDTGLNPGPTDDVQYDAPNINVRTQGRVIIGFAAGEGPGSQPRIIEPQTGLTTTADDDGLWGYGNPKQVFGRTTYVFSGTNYQPRLITITIDEEDRTVARADSSTRELDEDANGLIQVELDANGAPLTGTINLSTIKGTPLFPGSTANMGGFVMSTTGVEVRSANAVQTSVLVEPDNVVGVVGTATILTSEPGSYLATITAPTTPPDHYESLGASPVDVPLFQEPGTPKGFARNFAELAHLDVDVVDTDLNAIPGATVSIVSAARRAAGDPDGVERSDDTSVAGRVTFLDLPVNPTNPTGADVQWDATVEVDGYDLSAARVQIVTETSSCFPDCPPQVFLRAGGHQSMQFVLPRFGSINGNVSGQNDGTGALTPLPIGGRSPLTVTGQRIAGPNGVALPTPDTAVAAIVDPRDSDGFRITGKPGWYTVSVSDPEYEPVPVREPNPDGLMRNGQVIPVVPVELRLPGDVPVWLVVNDTDRDQDQSYILRIARGEIDLTVREDTRTGPGLAGALVTLTGPGDDPTVLFDNVETLAGGRLPMPNLLPGIYRLEVRKTAPVDPADPTGPREDAYFPVIVRITVPIGSTVPARTVEVNVPLPQIGGGITGTLGAFNSDVQRVPLPDSVDIARAYTPPQVDAEGTLKDNEATEGDIDRGALPTPSVTVTPAGAAGTPRPFTFENLASGLHDLTFSTETGYTAPTKLPVPVLGVATSAVGEIDYVALDRIVVVRVTADGAAATDAEVTLTDPRGNDEEFVESPEGTFTFVVPPEIDDYSLTVKKDLFETSDTTVNVPTGDPATFPPVDVPLSGNLARIEGVAQKLTEPGRQTTFNDEGTASLIQASGGAVKDTDEPDASGNYSLEVDEPGQYRVRLELDGFATRESANFSVPLGVVTPAPSVVVPALATFSIQVDSPPAPGAVTVVVSSPPSQTGVTPRVDDDVWTFRVDPDFAYQFRVTSPQFLSQTVTPTPADPAPGQIVPQVGVTLQPRTITGRVTTGTTATGVGQAAVQATKGAATRNTTTAGGTGPNVGNYTVSRIDAGSWAIVAEKLGTGRNTTTVVVPDDSANLTGANITLIARDVNVTFTLQNPSGTGIAGKVELLDADGDVVASGTGTTGPVTVTAKETAFPTASPLTWRATSSGRIPDTGTASIDDLTNTLNQETLTLPIGVVQLARPTITGRVLAPNGNNSNNADVFMCLGATGACDETTTDVVTDSSNAQGQYSVVPTSAGTWRLRAEKGNQATVGFEIVEVGAEGELDPRPPVNLQLVAPP